MRRSGDLVVVFLLMVDLMCEVVELWSVIGSVADGFVVWVLVVVFAEEFTILVDFFYFFIE